MFHLLFFTLLFASNAFSQDWTSIDQDFRESNFTAARTKLSEVLNKTPKDFGALWRLSRLEVFEADFATSDSLKEAGYQKAFQLAKLAISSSPSESHGYLRLASAAGKIALFKGVLEAREYILILKENIDKSISLNTGGPEIQAWSNFILGKAHLKLTDTPAIVRRPIGLGWGSIILAETHLIKAKDLKPDSVLIWVEIAKLRMKQKNRKGFDEAIAKARNLPVIEPTDREGKTALATLKWND